MIEIRVESVDSMEKLLPPLLEEHYEELTLNKDVVKLDVDWARYRNLEAAGALFALGAWDKEALVGYAVFFLQHHAHYKSLCVASNDVLFLRKQYRTKSTAGLRLIKESEARLKALGVAKIVWHIKHANDWSQILYRSGYADEEKIVGKLLRN